MSCLPSQLSQLVEYDQGPEKLVMSRLIGLFLNELPDRLERMERSIQEGDLGRLEFDASIVRVAAQSIAAFELVELCRQLERSSMRRDPRQQLSILQRLQHRSRDTTDRLVELRQQLAS
jgi:HPt (histidine-containing phosphotransfer) domain-containing protein